MSLASWRELVDSAAKRASSLQRGFIRFSTMGTRRRAEKSACAVAVSHILLHFRACRTISVRSWVKLCYPVGLARLLDIFLRNLSLHFCEYWWIDPLYGRNLPYDLSMQMSAGQRSAHCRRTLSENSVKEKRSCKRPRWPHRPRPPLPQQARRWAPLRLNASRSRNPPKIAALCLYLATATVLASLTAVCASAQMPYLGLAPGIPFTGNVTPPGGQETNVVLGWDAKLAWYGGCQFMVYQSSDNSLWWVGGYNDAGSMLCSNTYQYGSGQVPTFSVNDDGFMVERTATLHRTPSGMAATSGAARDRSRATASSLQLIADVPGSERLGAFDHH